MNIEAIIIDYLQNKLQTDSVHGEIPDSPTGEFFVVDLILTDKYSFHITLQNL